MRQIGANIYTEIYLWGCNPGFVVTDDGAFIGGIAVFLNGYERRTTDVDVFTADAAHRLRLTPASFVRCAAGAILW